MTEIRSDIEPIKSLIERVSAIENQITRLAERIETFEAKHCMHVLVPVDEYDALIAAQAVQVPEGWEIVDWSVKIRDTSGNPQGFYVLWRDSTPESALAGAVAQIEQAEAKDGDE